MKRPVTLVVATALMASAAWTAAQTPMFRLRTDIVFVDVSVTVDRRPLEGLQAEDFSLTDNGVPQRVDDVAAEGMPIDVSLLVDLSGSVVDNIEAFRDDVRRFAALLRPIDRIRVVSFASDVHDEAPLATVSGPMVLDFGHGGGGTSLNDGLAYAMLRPEDPARRHLIIVFTDGFDTASVLSNRRIPDLAQHSAAVIHAVLVPGHASTLSPLEPGARDALIEAAARTGGEAHTLSSAFGDFKRVFDNFRASYVLRFKPTGVDPSGWHALTVTVRGPRAGSAVVRARRGYFGG
jgi:hypothetical protein